jgi:hypothetical protein
MTIILDETDNSVEVLLAAAPAANQLQVYSSYVDLPAYTPAKTDTVTNGVTAVTAVAAPGGSVQRQVKAIMVYNADTASATVTVRFKNNATTTILRKFEIAVGETLVYTDVAGFAVLPASTLGGRLLGFQVITSGVSVTASAGVNSWFARLFAAGGGGGGGTSVSVSAACAAGGSAGGYAEKTFTVTPGTAYTCAIGTAGTAGANTGGTGGTGGNTTLAVGATTVTANGGLGGVGQAGGTSVIYVAAGAVAAISTNGDVNSSGPAGEHGCRDSGTVGRSGGGGSNLLGGGGIGLIAAGAGSAGTGYGSGGGGGLVLNGSAAVIGGVGTQGLIVIEERS